MPIDKRYQVFIASTFTDLEEVRASVFQRLQRNEFIPRGMEQMTAQSRQSWPAIADTIDEVDYVVVLVGKRYGSIPKGESVSFTEKEYDYAIESSKPVLAFVHRDQPGQDKSIEADPVAQERLMRFRAKIDDNGLHEFWNVPSTLAADVLDALHLETERNPRPGWIRGDSVPERLASKVEDILNPAETLGVARISLDGNADPDALRPALANAREIRIESTSAVRLIENYQDQIVEALSRGAQIKILVPKPDTIFVSDVEGMESIFEARTGISAEIKSIDGRMRECRVQASRSFASGESQSVGRVQVGYFSTQFRQSLILCDDDWGWLTIIMPPWRAPVSPSLELTKGDRKSLLMRSLEHFDTLWGVCDERGDVREV